MRFLGLALLVLSSGCGFTNPGGGTRTLWVNAQLSTDGSTAGSRARVSVKLGSSNGDVVRNAEVAIRGGPLARTVVPFDDQRLDYRLDGFTWADGIRLEVIRGTDLVDGSIDAPGATVITLPVANTTFSRGAGMPFIVRWKDEHGVVAKSTTLHLDKAKIDQTLPPGALEQSLDPNTLVVGNEKVSVERSNEVELAGGASGSTLSAGTRHEIEFKVE
ncbi:MAG: hypothetical protein U0228_16975 [Myxococcaceae bacterium]